MGYSGDAAEEVVKMTLDGAEFVIRLGGKGAMELAKLIYAVLRDQKKTKGKSRLSAMIRSGKELRAFAVKDEDLLKFCRAAKKYGVLYTVLKDKDAKDGVTDVMVRAEDAAKVNRIFERFKLATVDMASVQSEIVPEKETEKTGTEKGKVEKAVEKFKKEADGGKKKTGAVKEKTEAGEKKAAEKTDGSGEKESSKTEEKKTAEKAAEPGEKKTPDPGDKSASSEDKAEAFLEELFGQEKESEKAQRGNPTGGRDQKSRRSESSSKKKETTGRDASDGNSTRHSVKEELKEIRNEQKASPEQKKEPSQNREVSGKNNASRNQNSKNRNSGKQNSKGYKNRKKSGNSRNASQYSGKNNAQKSAAKQMNRSKGARG